VEPEPEDACDVDGIGSDGEKVRVFRVGREVFVRRGGRDRVRRDEGFRRCAFVEAGDLYSEAKVVPVFRRLVVEEIVDVACGAEGGCEDFFAVGTSDAEARAARWWLVITAIGSRIAFHSYSRMSSLLDALFFAAVCVFRSACYMAMKGYTHLDVSVPLFRPPP
jgi:hypothetical protein